MNVDAYVEPVSQGEAEWLTSQRQWTSGWRRSFLTALPLVYLIYAGVSVAQNSPSTQVWGYLILIAFSACWLAMPLTPMTSSRFWTCYGILFALFVAELPFARAAGFVMCIYLTIAIVARLGSRGLTLVGAYAAAALVVPVAIPGWHVSIDRSFADVTPIAIPVVAATMLAITQVLRGNRALAEAQVEIARLAAENERIRIARDLHDLLGHSLTTITVKAGLAARLGEAGHERAFREMADVEALARQALADVRATVSNYRDVTLTQELAAGRELLHAAGITADLPRAVDVVDPGHHELFGWVVREGLTNIVRHSHASSCAVRLSPTSVEIVDDGVGGTAPPGNGLAGLRERVTAAGGVVDAGPLQPRGWRLRVSLMPAGTT
jgi:two-component system, NarL family, sensor histidine kinase DesK